MSPFMDVKQCAEYLIVKPSTLRQWVFFNRIPSRKHGGKRVFLKAEIDRWSESRSSHRQEPCLSPFEKVRRELRSLTTDFTAHPPKQKEVG
jgi:excisionase family DNA binding protein